MQCINRERHSALSYKQASELTLKSKGTETIERCSTKAIFCITMKEAATVLLLVAFGMLSESALITEQTEAKEWSLWKQVLQH